MMCIGHDNAVADTVTFKKDTQIDCASVVALGTLVGCECTPRIVYAKEEDTTPQLMQQTRRWWPRLLGPLLIDAV